MNKFSKDLLQGMREACEFAESKATAARVHIVKQTSDPEPLQAARKLLGRVVDLKHPTARGPRGRLGRV
jgi:hypothetical protein